MFGLGLYILGWILYVLLGGMIPFLYASPSVLCLYPCRCFRRRNTINHNPRATLNFLSFSSLTPFRLQIPNLCVHPPPHSTLTLFLFLRHRGQWRICKMSLVFSFLVYKRRREESLGLLTASLLHSAQEILSHLLITFIGTKPLKLNLLHICLKFPISFRPDISQLHEM